MTNSNRDDELEIIRQLLIATARRSENNDEAIEQLTQNMSQLTANVNHLTMRMEESVENADADRAVMLAIQTEIQEMQAEVRGLQTENRRILGRVFGEEP